MENFFKSKMKDSKVRTNKKARKRKPGFFQNLAAISVKGDLTRDKRNFFTYLLQVLFKAMWFSEE